MTDMVFYAALQRCYGIDRKARRCGNCPLLREINCELRMKDEIRHRIVLARQEEHRNGRQLTFEDMQTGGTAAI